MILFIEEQETSADLYFEEMEARGLPVRLFLSVDSAWEFLDDLKAMKEPLDLVILDVMMPPGRLFEKRDTSDGLNTGLHFFRLLRERFPKVPIVFLTNRTAPIVAQTIAGDANTVVRIKSDTFPDEFAEEIRMLYSRSGESGEHASARE